MDRRRQLGQTGEDIAAAYLTELGWTVIDRNWRAGRLGEVDIVAIAAGAPRTYVFCEVKCRRGLGYGDPLEAITAAKLARLNSLAHAWLTVHQVRYDRARLDAIGVLLEPGRPPTISHQQAVTR